MSGVTKESALIAQIWFGVCLVVGLGIVFGSQYVTCGELNLVGSPYSCSNGTDGNSYWVTTGLCFVVWGIFKSLFALAGARTH